jgi:hypothetical protein
VAAIRSCVTSRLSAQHFRPPASQTHEHTYRSSARRRNVEFEAARDFFCSRSPPPAVQQQTSTWAGPTQLYHLPCLISRFLPSLSLISSPARRAPPGPRLRSPTATGLAATPPGWIPGGSAPSSFAGRIRTASSRIRWSPDEIL